MDRRTFLTTTALGTSLAGCQSREAAAVKASVSVPAFELDELTIADLSEGMRSGRWSARKLAEFYLARIAALNLKGPELRAVIETNPDALAIADQPANSSMSSHPAKEPDGNGRGPWRLIQSNPEFRPPWPASTVVHVSNTTPMPTVARRGRASRSPAAESVAMPEFAARHVADVIA